MSAPALELRDVRKSYASGVALEGVSFAVDAGSVLVLLGTSGSGKTTALKTINALVHPDSGIVTVLGREVAEWDPIALRRRIGWVIQEVGLLPHLSVAENVETPLVYSTVPATEWRPRALRALERVGLVARADHRPSELSGGEAQRAAIARALVTQPRLLLADEPTGNLDSATGEQIARLLDDLHAEGRTIVLVTHNESLARRAQRMIRLCDGRIEADQRLRAPERVGGG